MSSKSIEKRLEAIEEQLGTKQVTRALIIQDKSSSMGGRVKQTIDGYNEYISSLAEDDSDELYLTLIQFDHEYEIVEDSTAIGKVEPLDNSRYQIRGSTALYDAVGRGINELKGDLNKGERAIVVIMTDGEENSSNEFDQRSISRLIEKCEEEGHWTFVFLGAGQNAWSGGQAMGLRRNQAVFYGSDSRSHSHAYSSLAVATNSTRAGSASATADFGAKVARNMSSEGADVQLENKSESKEEEKTSGSRS